MNPALRFNNSYLMDAEIRQIVLWPCRIVPSAFRQSNKAVGLSARKYLTVAVWPANFDADYLRAASKSEMQAHIIIRDVAGAAAHLLNIFVIADNHGNLGADAVSVGLRSSRDHTQPMI